MDREPHFKTLRWTIDQLNKFDLLYENMKPKPVLSLGKFFHLVSLIFCFREKKKKRFDPLQLQSK